MPDLLVNDIDEQMLQRIRALADEHGWSTNTVIVRALKFALGLSADDPAPRARGDIATLRGVWNQHESKAFSEAIEAFRRVDSNPLFEDDGKSGDKPR